MRAAKGPPSRTSRVRERPVYRLSRPDDIAGGPQEIRSPVFASRLVGTPNRLAGDPMQSLVDQFSPNIHDAPISAAAYDISSGTIATADRKGTVAVQRPGESAPGLVFEVDAAVEGALALVRGGSMVAVGDDSGTVAIYSTETGEEWFREAREGARGRVRAMRGLAMSPEGARLAAIAKDGHLRVWDLASGERAGQWSGFSGASVEFGPRGTRLLSMDNKGQPRIMDLMRIESLPTERLATPAQHARFTIDGTMIVAAGPAGLSLIRLVDGRLVNSFAIQGGSGILNILLSPDGTRVGVVTQRSVHYFSLPDFQPLQPSLRHNAPNPTGAGLWLPQVVKVAGDDGLMHSGGTGAAGTVSRVTGIGRVRLAAHADQIAVWQDDARVGAIRSPGALRDLLVDRDGQLCCLVPQRGPVSVVELSSGQEMFSAGPASEGAAEVALGGTVLAIRMRAGGVRWWNLAYGKGFELEWPRAVALSGSGAWMGVVTPRGAVRILDPDTGRDLMRAPLPTADVPILRMSFIPKKPELLTVDQDGVLTHYDLAGSAAGGAAAEGTDLLDFNGPVDRVWGIAGGRYAAVRLPEEGTSCIIFVDIASASVASETTQLHPDAWVDPANGRIIEPARASAFLERSSDGNELQVSRALPDDQWVTFGHRGILKASPGAGHAV